MSTKRSDRTHQEKEKFIEFLKQGKNRIEAAQLIGHKEAWASRTLKKIREMEPSRLENTTEAVKCEPQEQDMLQTTQKFQTAPEPTQTIENTPKEEKATEAANTKAEKQTFSFRTEQGYIEDWKAYAETIGTKDVGALWAAAINEYIENHPLTANQQEIYNLKKKIIEMQRKEK